MSDDPLFNSPEEVIKFALDETVVQKLGCIDWVRSLEEELDIAKRQLWEATMAERSLRALLDGGMYMPRDPGQPMMLDAEISPMAFYDSSWTKPEPAQPPPTAPTSVRAEEQKAPPPRPPTIPSVSTVSVPKPEKIPTLPPASAPPKSPPKTPCAPGDLAAATVVKSPPRPPATGVHAPVDYEAVCAVIMGALDVLLDRYPDTLDAGKVALHTGEKQSRVYKALQMLGERGVIQYTQRPDSNQIIVLRPDAPMPHYDLTERQQRVFDWLAIQADPAGNVSASLKAIDKGAGVAGHSSYDVLWTLQRKGWLTIVSQGDSVTPGAYRIAEARRLDRAEPVAKPPENPVVQAPAPDIGKPITPAPPAAPAPEAYVQPPVAGSVTAPEPAQAGPKAPPRPLERISERKIKLARELLDQGWTITAAAGRVDADLAALKAALEIA